MGFRNVRPRWLSLWPVIILFPLVRHSLTFSEILDVRLPHHFFYCVQCVALMVICVHVCVCMCAKHHSKSDKMCVFRRGPGDKTYEDSKEHCWPAAEPGRNHVQSSRDTDQPQVDAQIVLAITCWYFIWTYTREFISHPHFHRQPWTWSTNPAVTSSQHCQGRINSTSKTEKFMYLLLHTLCHRFLKFLH